MVSYASLGGLGAREGIPVVHTWEPPPPPPPRIVVAATAGIRILAAMLLLLPLFLFRPNRCSAAWWVWLPVLIAAFVGFTILSLTTDEELNLPQALCAFVIGLGAVWLLMPWLKSRYRIVAFFKTLPLLAGFSLLAFVPALLRESGGWFDLRPILAGLLALVSLVATLALTFGGLSVRRRFGRIRFLLWLAVWIVLAWTLIVVPFLFMGSLWSRTDWGRYLLAILLVSAITLALLLPLVLLSFFQPFYRARFLAFLNAPQPAPSAEATAPPNSVALAESRTDSGPGGT